MKTLRFGMFGNGYAAQRHKKAIEHIGGKLEWISDPIFSNGACFDLMSSAVLKKDPPSFLDFNAVDFVVIASPSYLHREQTKEALQKCSGQVICEKPICLPWEPIIDDDRINVCLQLRYIKDLPKKADLVRAVMVRDQKFFDSWKGNPRLAGGNLYEFYVHYIDLAILLGADFEGSVLSDGEQKRKIFGHYDEIGYPEGGMGYHIDIMQLNMQDLYNRMYEDIIQGGGIKPKDIFYTMWILNRYSEIYGYRKSGIDKPVFISKKLL